MEKRPQLLRGFHLCKPSARHRQRVSYLLKSQESAVLRPEHACALTSRRAALSKVLDKHSRVRGRKKPCDLAADPPALMPCQRFISKLKIYTISWSGNSRRIIPVHLKPMLPTMNDYTPKQRRYGTAISYCKSHRSCQLSKVASCGKRL